ncbi:CHAT domain-containing protein [Lactarius pseudohatsudake]|nr:CHAT domain-containing protein [Lactarius pseudohatsudake]
MANVVLESMSIHEIDSFIARVQQILAKSPRSEPLRIPFLISLALKQSLRYIRSNQKEDLDKSIFHLTELILLGPLAWLEYGPCIFEVLFLLADALLKRSIVSNKPEDAIVATKYLRHLRSQPQAALSFPHISVTRLLLRVLTLQVVLEASNVEENIEEMTFLFHELLTSDASEGDIACFGILLAGAFLSNRRLWVLDRPSDQVIECLRLAKVREPELRVVHLELSLCLCIRYNMTLVNDYYEEAASILDDLIASSPPGDIQDKRTARIQEAVAASAVLRSMLHPTPEYSEEAMYRARTTVSSDPVGHDFRPILNRSWETVAEARFGYFGPIDGHEAHPRISRPVPVRSFGGSEAGAEVERMFKNIELLKGLLSGIRNNDITNIDEALELGRTKLTSSIPTHPPMSILFEAFGDMLLEAFWRTNKIKYLNESISVRRQNVRRSSLRSACLGSILMFSCTLFIRFVESPSHSTEDLDEGLELLSQYVNDRYLNPPARFHVAYSWASLARCASHPSVSTAYETALSLMQDTLHFAPTLQLQHATLAMYDLSHNIPLDYASYQIDLRQLEEAIVTLERGRALLWSEMRRFRASIEQLQQAHPQLAHKFALINRDLEELTKSIPPSHELSVDDGATDDARAVDEFGRLLLKQRRLLKERDNLVSQIQALPGFNSFLTYLSFDTLRSAASSGPVVIINHSKWRSDILILFQNTSPSLISTPHNFYDRATALKDKLLDSRLKYGLDSSHYDETLAFVLAELYSLVGKPVIDRLRQLKVPEQSRIWWCPTSVFCSLPLHAMGPIPSDDGEKRYFLDLYICSYTPSLSALIQSRNGGFSSKSSDRPSLLLVAQPDPSLPTVGGEIQVVRALDTVTEVTSLLSEAATPATVIDGFRHHRFVHFACHGTLEPGKPFEAGFELHGDERLTLLEIVRSDLPTAEFAFLSACHTAEVTEGSVVDEGLHLAAAVQYCGFRSVVGTMWAMVDDDGRDLAKHFYKAMFSTSRGEQGIRYHERSAKALRFAVKKLRRKRWITLERWVNFVHYGA